MHGYENSDLNRGKVFTCRLRNRGIALTELFFKLHVKALILTLMYEDLLDSSDT